MTKVTHLTLDEGGGLNRRRIHLREISGDVDTPLETAGQDLRAARLRRGDDLATVSKALKIRKDHLEALEEDRFDALPGRTYAIGFVRAYADYLGLDPVVSVERFKREIAGRDEGPQQSLFAPTDDERRLPHGWMIIAVVVLVLLVYGAYWLARSADTMLSEPVAPVPARIAVPERPRPEPKALTPAAPTASTEAPGTAEPQAPTITAPGGILGANPGIAPDTSTTPSALPPSGTASDGGAAAPAEPPPPQGRVYGQQNTEARVILHVLAPTRVLVEGDDGVVYINRALQPGDSFRVPDRVGLTLTTPNGGAVSLDLDGQPMGMAGRPKQMAEAVSLDPQAIVDRYNGTRPH